MGDRTRVAGPEQCAAPKVEGYVALPVFKGANVRQDGREANVPRKIWVVSQARGSAYVESGGTKVIAACYGPRDTIRLKEYSSKGKLDCSLKFAPFAQKHYPSNTKDPRERELSTLLQQALLPSIILEKYPKSLIDIFVTVLEDDGSCLASAITASSLALANANVELFDLVAACSLTLCGSTLVLDPSKDEETSKERVAEMTVALMPSLGEISGIAQAGVMPFERMSQAMAMAVNGCACVNQVQQHVLREAIEKKASAEKP